MLPKILQNITDALLSRAKNMNAKDEKFIFQGVYNLLYGTVELIMVSAEASAVTGNSQTLPADQLEVGFPKRLNSRLMTNLFNQRLEINSQSTVLTIF